ncbi:MAG TPA: hypothetical protein IAA29_01660 [Candidatus Paenibacillus intestinavium]|nr:hypothetical protein [Candidatus Paenibacillus intestinavium]
MADIKKKLEMLVDVDQPIEEIKECIIAISIMHGSQQIEILKEVEIWLGETIEQATPKVTKQKDDSNEGEETDIVGKE